MERIFDKFEKLNPDYIFVLGDSSLQKKEVYNSFFNRFGEKIFFSPGNNEIKDGTLSEYQDNVGYLNKIVESEDIRFVLLNSNAGINDVQKFLKSSIKENYNKTQILLTHHRIWDDTLLSENPYEHDKSYYFKDLYPFLKNNIAAIFSGNSKRQYFSDYRVMGSKQNVNNIFWVDQIGDIASYSVGTGDGKPKIGFVHVRNLHNELIVKPHHINSEGIDPIPISKIRLSEGSFDHNKSSEKKNENWLYKYYSNFIHFVYNAPRIKLLFLTFFIGCLAGFFVSRKVIK